MPEGIVVKGLHKLVLDTVQNVEQTDPRLAQEVSRPPILLFRDRSTGGESFQHNASVSLLHEGLHPSLHLLTAQQWPVEGESPMGKQFLLRLEHMNINGKEGPISVDLAKVFTLGRVVRTTELSLTANQLAVDAKVNSLVWPSGKWRVHDGGEEVVYSGTRVTLQPGEIKTLVVEIE